MKKYANIFFLLNNNNKNERHTNHNYFEPCKQKLKHKSVDNIICRPTQSIHMVMKTEDLPISDTEF